MVKNIFIFYPAPTGGAYWRLKMITEENKKILLVDDEPLVAMKEASMIRNHGYDVVTALNREEAINIYSEDDGLDLVLMDIDFEDEDKDGTDLAREILDIRETPLGFLTNHTEEKYVKKAFGIRHYGYLLKTSGEHIIIESIRRALTQYEEEHNRRINEERLFRIYDNLPAAVLITDKNRILIEANSYSVRMFGLPSDEFGRERIGDMLRCKNAQDEVCGYSGFCRDCSLKEIIETTLQNAKENYRMEAEIFRKLPDGLSRHTFLVSTSKIATTKGQNAIVLLEDITVQKQLEKQLRLSEQKYRRYIEDCPLGIFVADKCLNFLYVNTAACELTGYSKEELLNMNVYDFATPEWEIPKENLHKTIVVNGKISEEIPFTTKSGKHRYWSVNTVCLDENSTISFAEDITDAVKREEKLSALLQENKQLLIEINHRVKNNLANVEALAMVELNYKEKDKEEAIDDIISRIRSIGLIHEILYTRESFKELHLQTYLTELVTKIVESYDTPDRKCVVTCNIETLMLSTKICTSIGIITTELLTNTYKYADFHGSCEVSLSLSVENEQYHYCYTDSGTGLPEKIQSFEDFPAGTGHLLIREIVKGLGGSISLDRSSSTAFHIWF